jgi:hypothetical protein
LNGIKYLEPGIVTEQQITLSELALFVGTFVELVVPEPPNFLRYVHLRSYNALPFVELEKCIGSVVPMSG